MAVQEQLDSQPFYVVSDDAFLRMMKQLDPKDNTEPKKYVKTYTNICPHRNKNDCECPFNLNFLKKKEGDEFGIIMRVSQGKLKPVVPLSYLRVWFQHKVSQ